MISDPDKSSQSTGKKSDQMKQVNLPDISSLLDVVKLLPIQEHFNFLRIGYLLELEVDLGG